MPIPIIKTEINYFYYTLVFYCITVLYLIPYNLEIPHAKLFLPILAIILIFQLLYYRDKLQISDIIITCLVFIITLINTSSYQLFRYSLPISLIAIGFSGFPKIKIKKSYLTILCWLSTITMIYQMAIYRRIEFDGSLRISLSNEDPNVSGLFMLLFFFLSIKAKFKPGIILTLVSSCLFLSRNYFFSLIIFFTILCFEKPFAKLASKINFVVIFIIANIFGVLVGEFFLNFVEVGYEYDTGSNRLFAVNDASNLFRFEANRFLMQSYLNDWRLALKGYGENYETIFRPIGAIIHNSFLEVIAYTGIILGIIYFCILIRAISSYYKYDNYKYIFSYLFFSLFLHSAFQGVTPFLFISILALSLEENKPQNLVKNR
ncbi:hypothetical protein [Calothrix sp. UHCC 0171]|uniref:hypothetical protein n=1 Tax=Calothrix sp. UHCC 0171 TaxID=3110245 RepID=UPI002B201A51|nr:hypothetical protein [Calothrix sp. UHCC 0171]MEA5573379.1 hypothetical protein [Calothrix sp. UHCC 0171]